MNEFDKSLSLVTIEEIRIDLFFMPFFLDDSILRFHLRTSIKLFDMCIYGDFKTIYSQTYEYYRLTKGNYTDHHINKLIDHLYEEYMGPINVTSEIEISKDFFKKDLIENLLVVNFDSSLPWEKYESLISENSEESILYLSEDSQKELVETTKNILKVTGENSKGIYEILMELKTGQEINNVLCFMEFLKSCHLQDFQNNLESPEEKKLLSSFEKYFPKFNGDLKESPYTLLNYLALQQEIDKFYSYVYKLFDPDSE